MTKRTPQFRMTTTAAIRRAAALFFSIKIAFFASVGGAAAGDIFFMAGGAEARVQVQSMQARKFATVVPQRFDFSCGSAALATLLTHHYNKPTGEADPLQAMWAVGDQQRIRELGFSLFEMKAYLESLGLLADGFTLTLDRVEEIGVPGVALIDVKGYRHFVVVKGVSPRHVLVGDPSAGVKMIPRERFEKIWDGTILFVRSDVQTGRANFNSAKDWALTPLGPRFAARPLERETLEDALLHQTRPNFSGFTIDSIVGGRP